VLGVLQALHYQFKSGDSISAVDEGTCADEASVAKKTRTGNQSLGVAALVRIKRQQSAQRRIV